jgi:hypothetical protein
MNTTVIGPPISHVLALTHGVSWHAGRVPRRRRSEFGGCHRVSGRRRPRDGRAGSTTKGRAAQDAGGDGGVGVPGARLEPADAAEARFGDVTHDARRS